jgi:cofilin
MNTGVSVHDDVVVGFNRFRDHGEERYMTMKIIDEAWVVVESVSKHHEHETYEDYLASMPAAECRYAVVHIPVANETPRILFNAWSPDEASARQKMLYAGSKEPLKRVLVGVDFHWQASDMNQLRDAPDRCLEAAPTKKHKKSGNKNDHHFFIQKYHQQADESVLST